MKGFHSPGGTLCTSLTTPIMSCFLEFLAEKSNQMQPNKPTKVPSLGYSEKVSTTTGFVGTILTTAAELETNLVGDFSINFPVLLKILLEEEMKYFTCQLVR